jgi:hypothetical protein
MSERPLIWPMRAILYVGGFFVLVAGIQLFAFPGETDEIFAWTIDSRMSATCLGAFYWSAAVLALLSAREGTWARARLGVPGVLAFVWLTLLATLLHLDLFHLDEGGFRAQAAGWIWLAIYALEPPVLTAVYVMQLRAAGEDPPRLNPLPRPYRSFLIVCAVALLAFGPALFIAPLDVGAGWPWPLTELTGRAIAAWLVALGGLLAALAWEDERTRIRLGLLLLLTLVPLQAIALGRFGDEVDWDSAGAVAYVGALVVIAIAGVWGWRVSAGVPAHGDVERSRREPDR